MSSQKPKRVDADQDVRQYYEGEDTGQQGAFPEDTFAPVSRPSEKTIPDTTLSGGDVDAAQSGMDTGEEAVGGSTPTPDQDVVDELGKAVGVTYEDAEPLKVDDKLADRDAQRWELHPASSEDYQERLLELSGAGETTAQHSRPAKRPTRHRRTGEGASRRGNKKTSPGTRKTPKKRH